MNFTNISYVPQRIGAEVIKCDPGYYSEITKGMLWVGLTFYYISLFMRDKYDKRIVNMIEFGAFILMCGSLGSMYFMT